MNHVLPQSSSAPLLRAAVDGLPAYDPGADLDEVARLSGVTRVIKLSNNESPFGASPVVTDAVRQRLSEGLYRYPDPTGKRLTAAIGDSLEIDAARIVLGNGSENILELLCLAVLAQKTW